MQIVKKWWVGISILLVLLIGAVILLTSRNPQTGSSTLTGSSTWTEKGTAINGTYADAEVIDLGNNKFRMYYSIEPEVAGNKLEMYSATSTDGKTWTKEPGIRKEFATFPDVVKLTDGKFRLYFQNMGVIKSAISTDGLTWTDEPGVRIDKTLPGYNLENVGAQTTIRLADGTFIMVYRGVENKPYGSQKLPNNTTSYLFYATSPDGLSFTKKSLAINASNSALKGFIDGAEWVNWESNELRLYFWSYAGIYHAVYKNGSFSTAPVFDFTNSPGEPMPPSPPSDPTLAKVNSTWFMYFGQHTKGIYYATLGSSQR